MNFHTRIAAVVGALSLVTLAVAGPSAIAAPGPGPGPGHGYNSIPKMLPGNLPSVGFQANAVNEFGNEINLGGPANASYGNVTVTMSSWACQSGSWNNDNCSTPKGATFSTPITLNIYNPPSAGADTPGSLITSVTQTFKIPYRPSADNVHCTGANAGEWYAPMSKTCFNGLATNIMFDIDPHVKLPSTIVYGIAFNTETWGYAPYGPQPCNSPSYNNGADCPYDSLNVALSTDSTDVSAGSDPNPGTLWWYTHVTTNYCDNGAGGVNEFRLDSPGPSNGCWSFGTPNTLPAYVPSVRFSG